MYLAKSNNIELTGHSVRVKKFAIGIANKFLKNSTNSRLNKSDIIEIIELSALLHDIGKITDSFQSKLLGKSTNKKLKFMHNEIGWAIISKYLKHKYLDFIRNCVYWHHGISNKMNKYTIDEILNDVDENKFLSFLNGFINQKYIKSSSELSNWNYEKSPLYFHSTEQNREELNNINLIVRTCVISADRIVSSLEEDIVNKINIKNKTIEDISKIIDSNIPNPAVYLNTYLSKKDLKINTPYNNYRYNEQINISNNCGQTTILNGPAGFGKTVVGLLWSKQTNKKLIWVCPRNSIANSVYDRILDELNTLGIYNIGVELYLSGDVEKSNCNSTGFNSDIIVTNIDNYLKPMIDNSNMDKLYSILESDVIFDEYDEFINEAALFSGFLNVMQVRHRYTESRTLLLSATYQNLNIFWDYNTNKTVILPDKWKHYNAGHSNKFKVNVIDKFNSETIDLNGSDKLVIVNSIKLSQELHRKWKGNTALIHSEFETNKKNLIFDYILDCYGKNANKQEKKNIIGTHIIQTSYDISFRELYDTVISPQATIQRVGRLNRWGKYPDGISELNIYKENDMSESTMINLLYDKKLSDAWYLYMKSYNGKYLTLDELYIIYNDFHKKYDNQIINFIKSKINDSYEYLSKIYPKKRNLTNNNNNNIKFVGGNKLRYTTEEVFVIAKNYNTNSYCDAFPVKLFDNRIDKTFKEGEHGVTFNKILKEMLSLKNDKRFDYSYLDNKHLRKNLTIDDIREYSKCSLTPYIRFDEVYHDEYGFIKKDFFI